MKNTVFVCLLALASLLATSAKAQSCGNDSIYKLPYKNTYVKSTLAADNEFRTMRPTYMEIPTFETAKKILPVPIWAGHEKEIEMYWKAWEIGVGNIRNPQPGSGFVSPYIDTAYNGNIFMWDSAFILMFARYGERFRLQCGGLCLHLRKIRQGRAGWLAGSERFLPQCPRRRHELRHAAGSCS